MTTARTGGSIRFTKKSKNVRKPGTKRTPRLIRRCYVIHSIRSPWPPSEETPVAAHGLRPTKQPRPPRPNYPFRSLERTWGKGSGFCTLSWQWLGHSLNWLRHKKLPSPTPGSLEFLSNPHAFPAPNHCHTIPRSATLKPKLATKLALVASFLFQNSLDAPHPG